MKRLVQFLAVTVMFLASFVGLASEIRDGAPLWHQLAIYAVAGGVTVLSYAIYRLAGGTFRFRDMFEDE